MGGRVVSNPFTPRLLLFAGLLLFSACAYSSSGASADYVVGEEHVTNFPASQAFVMLQDVLRGDGILYNVKPGRQIVTEWQEADVSVGVFSGLIGASPRYRYEFQVLPLAGRQSKIIANVRAEDISQSEIERLKPSVKLHLFKQFDQYAAQYPPAPATPSSGGVNFSLLPGENLRELAKRVTGNADNWHQIAKDNKLSSPTDLAGVQSVWVRNSLLPKGSQQSPESQ
jgi:hypothetical protein